MNVKPTIQLNIEETIQILEGLKLHVRAEGNTGNRQVEDFTQVFKFHVLATNPDTGERTRQRFALEGRIVPRRGVGIDHDFVVRRICEEVGKVLAKNNLIFSGDSAPGPAMMRAIWRYIFNGGMRVSNHANGIGVFAQPQRTNFKIGTDPIEKLDDMRGAFTLAVANASVVKFYLGEEFPQWSGQTGSGGEHDWTPCRKKRLTPIIVHDCMHHFMSFVGSERRMEVFSGEDFDKLRAFVLSNIEQPDPEKQEEQQVDWVPSEDSETTPNEHEEVVEGKPGLLARIREKLLGPSLLP